MFQQSPFAKILVIILNMKAKFIKIKNIAIKQSQKDTHFQTKHHIRIIELRCSEPILRRYHLKFIISYLVTLNFSDTSYFHLILYHVNDQRERVTYASS